MSGDRCPFCSNPRTLFGCTPGRCLGPAARAKPEEAAIAKPPAPARPLGPERVVMASEVRSGPSGGRFLVLILDCTHAIWRPAGRCPRAPRTARCFGCSEPVMVSCAGHCGAEADARQALRSWTFHRGAWWCPGCMKPVRSGPAS